MRDLKRSERNRIVLTDGPTGDKIGIFYSTPTSPQFKAYRQAVVKRKGDKVVMDTWNPAVKFGLEIITGFDDGSFGYDGSPISSNPESPQYREDWKDLLAETAPDIIALVANVAFDGVKIDKADSGIEFDGEDVEDAIPLQKN
jgi:hypothetical protein